MSTWENLSAKVGMERLIEAMATRSTEIFHAHTLEKLKAADKRLQAKLREDYGQFFLRIYKAIDKGYSGAGTTPRSLSQPGWGGWPALSEPWTRRKTKHGVEGFYIGLSDKYAPFDQFLSGLTPKKVEQILGELVIEYTFQTPRKTSVAIYNLQTIGNLSSILTPKRGELPKTLLITTKVIAFRNLAGVKMKEWDIVDEIATADGHREQWRKINSRGRNGTRPIRALIGPQIQRFMKDVSFKALQEFNDSLK